MSNYSEDDIRRAAEMREWLIKQVSDKQEEIERFRTMLFFVDRLLKGSSFKAASGFESVTSASTIMRKNDESSMRHGGAHDQLPLSQISNETTNVQKIVFPPIGQEGEPAADNPEAMQIKRVKDGLLLASAKLSSTKVEIIPADGINFNINTAPFKSFFLNRILEGMKRRDEEKVHHKEIGESELLNYRVEEATDGLIKRIVINNYREKERLREIFNTSTWVLTRMFEKNVGLH
jgi:hypothetical protein